MDKLIVALLCLLLIKVSLADEEVKLENPVRSAEEDEIGSLPGLNETLRFKQYSGFLEAGAKKFLHYWLVEGNPETPDKPLVLWLNGGPGCSSIGNLLSNNGPVLVKSGGLLERNPYSWNERADILYLDAPVGTGYSYALEGHVSTNDDSSAEHNYNALRNFYAKFPHYKKSKLFLAGESYAGVYIPMLATLIQKDPSIKLTGMIIGNGFMDAKRLGESFIFYSYHHGLIDTEGWRGISRYCCDGNTPGHKQCHFAGTSIKCLDYIKQLSAFALTPPRGFNPQNIYDNCDSGAGQAREQLSAAEQMNYSSMMISSSLEALLGRKLDYELRGSFAPDNDNVRSCAAPSSRLHESYLNQADVKRALHIPDRLTRPFVHCSPLVNKSYNQTYAFMRGGMASQVSKILSSGKIRMLMYNGDVDLVANFIGNEWFAEELGRPLLVPHRSFNPNGGPHLGFAKNYDNLLYVTIRGAGHSPTLDRPAACFELIRQFLYDGDN